MSKRPRGTGSIYRQPDSRFLWVAYHLNGKLARESSHSEKMVDARNVLKRRMAAVESGNFLGPQLDRILVEELAEGLLADYRVNGKAFEWAKRCWKKHLEPVFGKRRAAAVGTDTLNAYIQSRRAEGAGNATINRELSLLQRAFTLAFEAQPPKVTRPLRFHRLAEPPPRKGFVEEAQYRKLTAVVTTEPWLRAMLALGYAYGFRKGELLDMRVRQVDLLDRSVSLDVGSTKNGQGRTVKLTSECHTLLVEMVRGKQPEQFLFTRSNGAPVKDFRGAWSALTVDAGVPGLLFHDLRRSAVRNMVRKGIPERVAMLISGHKTRSVFERYNIVSDSDLADAAKKLEIHSSFIVAPNQGTAEVAQDEVSLYDPRN